MAVRSESRKSMDEFRKELRRNIKTLNHETTLQIDGRLNSLSFVNIELCKTRESIKTLKRRLRSENVLVKRLAKQEIRTQRAYLEAILKARQKIYNSRLQKKLEGAADGVSDRKQI